MRPNKVKNLLARYELGQIFGLRPSIRTISDWPDDFVTLFDALKAHLQVLRRERRRFAP